MKTIHKTPVKDCPMCEEHKLCGECQFEKGHSPECSKYKAIDFDEYLEEALKNKELKDEYNKEILNK